MPGDGAVRGCQTGSVWREAMRRVGGQSALSLKRSVSEAYQTPCSTFRGSLQCTQQSLTLVELTFQQGVKSDGKQKIG